MVVKATFNCPSLFLRQSVCGKLRSASSGTVSTRDKRVARTGLSVCACIAQRFHEMIEETVAGAGGVTADERGINK
jgi:anti-sigma factor ChrR (cupin superfamily)